MHWLNLYCTVSVRAEYLITPWITQGVISAFINTADIPRTEFHSTPAVGILDEYDVQHLH